MEKKRKKKCTILFTYQYVTKQIKYRKILNFRLTIFKVLNLEIQEKILKKKEGK